MGAIEVSRNFRKLRIGNRLLERLLAAPLFDDKIAYMNGFSWHWDLDGSAMTIAEYRRMMIRLLNPYGFQEFYTNEPNIAIREENVFMARIGSRVSDEDRGRFRSLRFGVIR
jgi:acetoin utilization protein AcuA